MNSIIWRLYMYSVCTVYVHIMHIMWFIRTDNNVPALRPCTHSAPPDEAVCQGRVHHWLASMSLNSVVAREHSMTDASLQIPLALPSIDEKDLPALMAIVFTIHSLLPPRPSTPAVAPQGNALFLSFASACGMRSCSKFGTNNACPTIRCTGTTP